MGVEQIGQRARTEFDEDDSAPSTSESSNGSSNKPSTRLFGEGAQQAEPCCNSICNSAAVYLQK